MLTESTIPSARARGREFRPGWLDRIARRLVFGALEAMREGSIEVYDGSVCRRFGDPGAPEELRADVAIDDARFYRALLWGGTLGAAEAYVDGLWRTKELTALIRLLLRNESAFRDLNGPLTQLSALRQRLGHALRRNTKAGSRRNIAAHYDLSNDFYGLFLDETMTYSCGIFERPESTLRDASIAKLDRICRKLQLAPHDHVVEIGSGWGSFAVHAAKRYGCRVTTTTISVQQYEFARQRIAAAGLDDRVKVLLRDYRDLKGHYDKLVSIEMIEAVGWQYFDTFFKTCSELLKPDGAACIQVITMADRYYEDAKRSVDFIKRYIFPGSCIPSIGAMTRSLARATDLTVAHLEDITPHYAQTLRSWYDRFREELPKIHGLGFSPEFIRMWEFYLCYCEAGFHERTIGNVQMMLVKPRFRGELPMGTIAGANLP